MGGEVARVQQHMISVDHKDKLVFVFSKEYIHPFPLNIIFCCVRKIKGDHIQTGVISV